MTTDCKDGSLRLSSGTVGVESEVVVGLCDEMELGIAGGGGGRSGRPWGRVGGRDIVGLPK